MNTIKYVVLLVILFTWPAHGQLLTAATGLEKIRTNMDIAIKNKDSFDQSMLLINNNITEIKKAKDSTSDQKKLIYEEIVKNSNALKKVLKQERAITDLISKENDNLIVEAKQIEQLQSLINQIKANQELRTQIIADYQNQLTTYEAHKKSWKEREEKLRQQETTSIQSLRGIASDEETWINKKKNYKNELDRWTAEASKQQKIHNTFKGLSEGR